MNHRYSQLGALFILLAGGPAQAQPWAVFVDDVSGSACGIVNAVDPNGGEHVLVVLEDTNELVLVSDVDVILTDTFVDEENTVFISGESFGFIEFFEDADGLATLWWVIEPDNRVVGIDEFGDFFESDFFPDGFSNVACDACEFWDTAADCDEDFDGVDDGFDLCPGTAEGEPVDADGCSCFDFDSDADDVNDCFDECPDTPIDLAVNNDGCPIPADGDGGGNINIFAFGCGGPGAAALALTCLGMAGLGVSRRRS